MSKRNTATKQPQSKATKSTSTVGERIVARAVATRDRIESAPVDIDTPIPFVPTDPAPSACGPRPKRISLDMTMREVMGADQSWDEGGWDLLLYAAIDFANDACDITGGIPHPNRKGRSDTEMGARDCILAVIALAQKALGMLDAEEAERVRAKVTP